MVSISSAVLRAAIYSDIFSCALSFDELHRFAIGGKPFSKEKLKEVLSANDFLQYDGRYISLNDLSSRRKTRTYREKVSISKLRVAKKISRFLIHIPTIQFIGVSGAVAIGNADKNDDIDLFIICQSGTVWITRLLALSLLAFLGKRRSREAKKVSDLICLNMILDENSLKFPKEKNDVYIAHEIAQLIPLYSTNNTYKRFFSSNKWIRTILPNVDVKESYVRKTRSVFEKTSAFVFTLPPMLQLAKLVQIAYMREKKQSEIVTDYLLAFHPRDYRKEIIASYKRRCKERNISEI